MEYNAMIETKIMPEVEIGSNEPIMIYRDIHGGWHGDHTQNQYGEEFDWVEDVQDPFAVTITGYDLAKGSFPYVYDRILNERLRAEYEHADFGDADPAELNALINLFEENMGEFSSEVTDYLTTLDRPLAAACEMTSVSLKSSDPDFDYDSEKIGEFVDAIEDEVANRLENRQKQDRSDNSEKDIFFNDDGTEIVLNPDEYTVLQSQQIHKHLITLSENLQAEHRYMVCEYWENPRGVKEHMESGVTNDYLEALEMYTKSVHYLVSCSVSERNNSKRMEAFKKTTVKPPTKQELYKQAVSEDKFYLRADGHIEQLYYNPNGYDEKGQYVSDNYNYTEILKAANQADGSAEKFFEYFYEVSKQYLIDNNGGYDFKAEDARFNGDEHDLTGCTEETMKRLIEFAHEHEQLEKVNLKNEKQPDIKTGDFIDYNNKRWHVDYVGTDTIQLTNLNPLDSDKEIRATRWKDHIKEYTVVDKSEIDMSTLAPQKAKRSLAERIEKGKNKVREADKNKDKTVKPKNKKKGADIDG